MNEDTISRQVAIDALDALCDRECEYSKQQRSFMCGACRLGSAFDVIDELPSAQPEIIRCKDCKYWMRAYLSISGKHGCNVMRDYTAPDDYCFKAERRTDEA